MESVFLKLAESAANGGWPAAFAIGVTAIACAACVVGVAFAYAYMVKS